MNRYFPDVDEQLLAMPVERVVLDGEMIVVVDGVQEFDLLSQRIHPAASRVEKLAAETPAHFVAFDVLAIEDEVLMDRPYAERRERLESLELGPVRAHAGGRRPRRRRPVAHRRLGGGDRQAGRTRAYLPGERKGMVKIKRVRTADCVVVAFRIGKEEGTVGSLILGMYDEAGELRVVGHTSGFKAKEKRELLAFLEPYRTWERGSGEPSRWKSDEELAVGGPAARAGVRDRLRPHHRQPHPPRDQVAALARGQGAGGVPDRPAARLMAGADATVEVDGREVRVSSADRVIFPATERTPEITKLEVVEYYLAVGEGILRALRERPTTLERWPKGVHEGMTLSTREGHKGEAFYQKRVPKGAPDYLETARIEFPSGRHADEVCPTELAVVAWCGHMGTITFHPWPVRRADTEHPDELRLDLDPQEGTDFGEAQRVAAEARELLGELGLRGFPKTSGGRGIHIYVRIEPRWTFTDVRHAAIAFGRELSRRMPELVTTKWWKEERGERVFIDYNQNARDRTIASPYSIRAKPGAPVSAPLTWDEVPEVSPEDFNVASMPARFAEVGDRFAEIDDTHHSLEGLLEMYERDEEGDMPYPPDYPKMPGEPKRVQPSRDRDRKKE